MATMPDYTSFGERPAPQVGGGVARVEPVRDTLGQSVSAAGRDLDQASAIIDATNEQQDRIAAEAALNALQQKRIDLQFDPKTGFNNAKEGQAVGDQFSKRYLGQFEDATKSISDGLLNDRQRRLFMERAPIAALQYKSALMHHQAVQTEAFNDTTANNTIEVELRTMAQNPENDAIFRSSWARIDATIDDLSARKGLPPQASAKLKGQYLDAAYSARILSKLEGIPGIAAADPYGAEKMFKDVAKQMGPQAILNIGGKIQEGIKELQLRDNARAEVYGGVLDARTLHPAIQGVKPLAGVVEHLESRGRDYGPDGLLTSEKGAQGRMQVMPSTSTDPGFGVTPAKDTSPEELARVGRDYIGAMVARYGDPSLALAAYNAGPGTVDKWLTKYGDPRTGQISVNEWISQIPFAETKKYVTDGLRLYAKANGDTGPVSGPTANQLKAEMVPALLERSRQHAEAMYPNDPKFVDRYVARTLQYANQVLSFETARQQAAADTLTRAIVGEKGDGSDGVKTIEQALSIPAVKTAFEQASPQAQLAFQTRLAAGDKRFDEKAFSIYYGLLGMSSEDPPGFAKVNLTEYFDLMPTEKLVELSRLQKSINANDAKQQARDLNWQKAKSNVEDMLKPLGLGATAKANSTKAKETEQFYGRFNEAMQGYFEANKKWPDTQETRKMAASLLTEGKQSGGLLWDSSVRAFESEKGFYVPLPPLRSQERIEIESAYRNVFGKPATEPELRRFYTAWKMRNAKP